VDKDQKDYIIIDNIQVNAVGFDPKQPLNPDTATVDAEEYRKLKEDRDLLSLRLVNELKTRTEKPDFQTFVTHPGMNAGACENRLD
jgi:hypothetical protein